MPGFTISNWQGTRNRCQWCLSTWPNSLGSDSKCSSISLYWSDGFRFLTFLPYRCHTNKTYVKFAVRSFSIKRTMEFRSDKKQLRTCDIFRQVSEDISSNSDVIFYIIISVFISLIVRRPPSVIRGPHLSFTRSSFAHTFTKLSSRVVYYRHVFNKTQKLFLIKETNCFKVYSGFSANVMVYWFLLKSEKMCCNWKNWHLPKSEIGLEARYLLLSN